MRDTKPYPPEEIAGGWDFVPGKKRRKRKPTLAGAKWQAEKAGLVVAGATIKPDGSVALEFGPSGHSGHSISNTENTLNNWIAKHHAN